jgi:hypothetical protein
MAAMVVKNIMLIIYDAWFQYLCTMEIISLLLFTNVYVRLILDSHMYTVIDII